mmetsp:Transcript_8501/g.28495  ORF Transcript_8501/g.28495 Transcript_8501/m.28495 type:complete len:205 (-) Transcript_8501:1223-1837(-)
MRPLLDDGPSLEHKDDVSMCNGREPMGDNERRPSLAHLLQRSLDLILRVRVQRAGGLVEENDLRILQDGPGDSHPLLLSPGQLQAPLPYPRLVLVGEVHDRVMHSSNPSGFHYLLQSCILPAVGQVVPDCVVEQHSVLRHDADGLSQRLLFDLADIHAINAHGSLFLRVQLVEAHEQTRDGALACSCLPNERRGVSGRNFKGEV